MVRLAALKPLSLNDFVFSNKGRNKIFRGLTNDYAIVKWQDETDQNVFV